MEGATAAVAAPQGNEPVSPQPVAQVEPRPASQPRNQARLRGDGSAAYNYVGSEVRRIAMLATVAVAALVGLSFVF